MFDFFGAIHGDFRGKSFSEDSEWELGEVMIVKEVSGLSPIELGGYLGG